MKILDALKKSLILPRYQKLQYAKQCLEGEYSFLEEIGAAVNMGFYPFESKESILESVKEEKGEMEREYPQLA
jgi:hypothetical protein